MHKIETHIEIAAPVERVWSLLMDFPGYTRWNPFIRSIEGNAGFGQSLKVSIQPPSGNSMKFRPTVLSVDPNREFRWKGKLLLPGIFDGEHYFKVESKAGGRITFHHGEIFTGILVRLMRRTLDGDTKQGFIAMNEALKREAENP